MKRRDLILGSAALAMTSAIPPRAHAGAIGGHAFGSSWRLMPGEAIDPHAARRAIDSVVAAVDATMSPYRADSDITRFNRAVTRDVQAMPGDLCRVAEAAMSVAARTDGAFDPTVGPIVSRHGFGPIYGATGAWAGLAVSDGAISKAEPGLTLDLCGIAKGHALDEIVLSLQRMGVKSALVELGGEVAALGAHPDGRDWQIAIENPFSDVFAAQRIITPGMMRIATSGHRHNGVSGRTSHIIDTSTGRPALGTIGSVSVLAPIAMEADALATALCAMDDEHAIGFAQDQAISALFVLADREVMTGAFQTHVIA